MMILSQPLTAQTILANGVVASNLGKGDWIWQMPNTETRLGFSNTQQVINYEAGLKMQWITVKCGDGTNIWSQFNATLVAQAHTAGLKIFGWGYAFGYNSNQVAGEINVAINALNLGADGFIIDAETEYETNLNNKILAAQYCQGIRAAYPTKFLAHDPFPYISDHTNFPYAVFGYYVDAVMPQVYWLDSNLTPANAAARMSVEWNAWQNGLVGTNRSAIKPIVPEGQSFSPTTNQIDTGSQISAFITAIKNDPNPATVGGYNGVSFWECQDRNADMDAALGAATIGLPIAPQLKQLHVSTNGTVQIILDGSIGSTYEIDGSSNLTSWTAITNFINSNGVFQFIDPNATNNRTGYYRAKWLSN